jgi:uncharacterized protein
VVKIALLDVNVLLALGWPNHRHHRAAKDWFAQEGNHGWATCALTDLGFIRLSSNPSFVSEPVSPVTASAMLGELKKMGKHVFWQSPEILDPQIFRKALGHQQVNDAWLAELAKINKGRFITFDAGVATLEPAKGTVVVLGS